MKSKKTTTIALILFLGLLLIIVGRFLLRPPTPTTLSQIKQSNKTSKTSNPYTATLSLQKNSPTSYSIILDNSLDHKLNAFELQLSFNSQSIQVKDITAGSIWTQAITLNKKIDNTAGQISFSAGRSPNASQTDQLILATINIILKKPQTPIDLTIQPASQLAISGYNQSPTIQIQSLIN